MAQRSLFLGQACNYTLTNDAGPSTLDKVLTSNGDQFVSFSDVGNLLFDYKSVPTTFVQGVTTIGTGTADVYWVSFPTTLNPTQKIVILVMNSAILTGVVDGGAFSITFGDTFYRPFGNIFLTSELVVTTTIYPCLTSMSNSLASIVASATTTEDASRYLGFTTVYRGTTES